MFIFIRGVTGLWVAYKLHQCVVHVRGVMKRKEGKGWVAEKSKRIGGKRAVVAL